LNDETELHAALDELRREQAAITSRITAALLAGEDTGPIRAEAASMKRALVELEQRIADAVTQREAEAAEAISTAAAAIASGVADTILAKLSALAAPEHP
jgi:hypothetical protein